MIKNTIISILLGLDLFFLIGVAGSYERDLATFEETAIRAIIALAVMGVIALYATILERKENKNERRY